MASSAAASKLSALLAEKPVRFEITILSGMESDENDGNTILPLDQSLSLVGKYLGLDARSLPWITREIRQEYKRQRKQLLQETEKENSKDPEELPWSFYSTLSCLLLVNPDHATAWADRRRILLQIIQQDSSDKKSVSFWRQELDFVNLLMTQHSKAPFSWAHRKYVFQRIFSETDVAIAELIQAEIRVCKDVAERYPKNYYAWTHRRYCLWTFMASSTAEIDIKIELLKTEWEDILTKWLPFHVSDHSAVHYGSQVLQLWLETAFAKQSGRSVEHMAAKVLTDVRLLIESHDAHESLWILRRNVVRILIDSKNAEANKLARLDVESVAAKYSNGDVNAAANTAIVSVHPLTFLAWLEEAFSQERDAMANEDGTATNGGLFIVKELVHNALRGHSQIHHCMWTEEKVAKSKQTLSIYIIPPVRGSAHHRTLSQTSPKEKQQIHQGT